MLIPEALHIHWLNSLLRFKGQNAYMINRLNKKINLHPPLVYIDVMRVLCK